MCNLLRYILTAAIAFAIAGSINAQIGKVGINTTTPQAMLHVKDSSVVFTGINPLPVSPGAPPVSGAGTRMMWYPDKAALRAGNINGSQWNNDSIGLYSVAFGRNNRAKGNSATALGSGTIASGDASTAMGALTEASGTYSTAMGNSTEASGLYSTAMGFFTFAIGGNSLATGQQTHAIGGSTLAAGFSSSALGFSSIAMGNGVTANGLAALATGGVTSASGDFSTSMGFFTKAKPYASVVIGQYNDTTSISSISWNALDPVFVIGKGSSVSARSNAMTVLKNGKTGINTSAPVAMFHVKDSSVVFTGSGSFPGPSNPPVSGSGTRMMWYADRAAFRAGNVSNSEWNKDSIGLFSTALGHDVKAKGLSSCAFGEGAISSGIYSMATGNHTIASGFASTAFGTYTSASGDESTSLGSGTMASGYASTAIGSSNIASGEFSLASGFASTASGNAAVAVGQGSTSSGTGSFSTGFGSSAIGDVSFSMGFFTKARSYSSFVLGQYNDTTSISSTSWNVNDPVLIIGSGTANNARTNALTVLKNGNVGIGADASPNHRLHITNNNNGDGGWTEGVMVENTNLTTGEAAISFRNTAFPPGKQWIVGLNETPPNLSFNYGTTFTTANTRMALDTLGKLGIGTTSPDAHLHISKGTGGGMYNMNSSLIIEDNADQYIQFSNLNAGNCGLLSGNSNDDIRSAILFLGDSSITFRAGGNSTKVSIKNNGDVGIGTTAPVQKLHVAGNGYFTGNVGIGAASPAAKLDVDGTTILGTNGTALTEIIKLAVIKDVSNVPANSTVTATFAVANSALGSTVYISPESGLDNGLVIAYARVFPAGTVEVKFTNTTGTAIDPNNMNYYITVIR